MRIGYFGRRQLVKRCTTSRSCSEIYRPATRTLSEVGRPHSQGHVKITACTELVTLSGELWNTAAPECPAQEYALLKCSLLVMVTFRYRRRA